MDLSSMNKQLRFQLWRLRDSVKHGILGSLYRQRVFNRIYEKRLWGSEESVSGSGSDLSTTVALRERLPDLIRQYGISTVVDAPCGDFLWMQHVVHAIDRYIGIDIVPGIVEKNRAKHASDRVSFECADLVSSRLPKSDLILCRDCFIHLPTKALWKALENFRASGARYLLLTNDAAVDRYVDVPVGSYRSINFRLPPFAFPEPLEVISEGGDDRQLCLWELAALPPLQRA